MVISPRPRPSWVITLVRTCSPQAIGQPSGRAGCSSVVKATVAAAWSTAALRSWASRPGGGATMVSGRSGWRPSRRTVTWKWMAARRCISAPLSNSARTGERRQLRVRPSLPTVTNSVRGDGGQPPPAVLTMHLEPPRVGVAAVTLPGRLHPLGRDRHGDGHPAAALVVAVERGPDQFARRRISPGDVGTQLAPLLQQ